MSAGWGQLSNTDPLTSTLQEATATMLDLGQCQQRTADAVTFRQLCSDPVTGMSVCPVRSRRMRGEASVALGREWARLAPGVT